ncbi:MAG: YjbQ family protein [Candidatus Mcinerneyibacterium aminivorans]|jgi:secondary thiamine-phosphate synthase enzyme|uniref:YjbQ family protein n=1 Tax=Candidatus Mcinerneyibacterium aminivorans TaxID=2703815 RepID=A0A5D0MHE3_9BACT|nr:MAG: YjbQ family protein [Candidatus Mcinerneyibacterium aminivorans]
MPQEIINIKTTKREELYDITEKVRSVLSKCKVNTGVINIYVLGATAGIMIQENWDNSVQNDVITLLKKLIPQGVWEHDKQDGNGDSHLKSGLVSPSESIPIIDGRLGLSRWQNIFLCEFDGPRKSREIAITILKERN